MATDDVTLVRLLRDPELWGKLRECETRLRGADYDYIEDATHRAAHDFKVLDNYDVYQIIQHLVIDRLPKPAPLTAGDFVENLRHQLAGVRFDSEPGNDDYQNAIRRFLLLALVETDTTAPERYGDFKIDLGEWATDAGTDEKKFVSWELWNIDESNFILNADASPQGELGGFTLVGNLCGWCSQMALSAAEQWIYQFAPSIAKTAACCST